MFSLKYLFLGFADILHNEVGWFDLDQNNSNILASRLSTDATFVRAAVADRLSSITQNIALAVTAFVIAFIMEWRVTLVVLATFPLLVGASVGEVHVCHMFSPLNSFLLSEFSLLLHHNWCISNYFSKALVETLGKLMPVQAWSPERL
jgi:ABC-type multidrug transport system fused ATPase/permease subunit